MRAKIGAMVAAAAAAASAAGAAAWAKRRKGDKGSHVAASKAAGSADVVRAQPAGAAAKPEPEAGIKPAATVDRPAVGEDDLTTIKGLGKVTVTKLAERGITSFAQIAAWTDADLTEVGPQINVSPGRIKREDWVGQARALSEG